MRKVLLSLVAIAMMGMVSMSCATHSRSVRTYSSEDNTYPSQQEWKRCAVCDGKGSCNACKGTGKISGDRCKACKGSGKCSTCKGNGGYYLEN